MAGPGAIAACEEAVSREAAHLEDSLTQTGALTGVQHKFIVRQAELWLELREIVRQESADLLVVGTHGRHGIAKLFFGFYRRADFPSGRLSSVDLWATHRWPPLVWNVLHAPHVSVWDRLRIRISPRPAASHCGCQSAWSHTCFSQYRSSRTVTTDEGLGNYQVDARMRTLQRLTELADNAGLDLRPELYAEFESGRPVSEKILETADKLRADLIIMGLPDAVTRLNKNKKGS